MTPAQWDVARETLLELVRRQSTDQAMWLTPVTKNEDYLMRELRRLHAAIERTFEGDDLPGAACPRCQGGRRIATSVGVFLDCPECHGRGVVLT